MSILFCSKRKWIDNNNLMKLPRSPGRHLHTFAEHAVEQFYHSTNPSRILCFIHFMIALKEKHCEQVFTATEKIGRKTIDPTTDWVWKFCYRRSRARGDNNKLNTWNIWKIRGQEMRRRRRRFCEISQKQTATEDEEGTKKHDLIGDADRHFQFYFYFLELPSHSTRSRALSLILFFFIIVFMHLLSSHLKISSITLLRLRRSLSSAPFALFISNFSFIYTRR